MRQAQNGHVLVRVLGATAAVLVADQATKEWAVSALSEGPTSKFLGVRFKLYFNPGAAFSSFTGGSAGPYLAVLAIVISAFLIRAGTKAPNRRNQIVYGAIAGGALGNFVDRLVRADDGWLSGKVVDFIDVGWWPVFNIADSALVGGVVLLVLFTLTQAEPEHEHHD